MAEIPNVVAGEPVESNWGNLIRSRSAQRYADVTARDASVVLPETGELAWLDNPPALTYYDGTAWVDLIYPGSGDTHWVNLTGDTMTGDLVVPNIDVGGDYKGMQQVIFDADGGTETLSATIETEALQSLIPPNPIGGTATPWLIRLEAQMQATTVAAPDFATMRLLVNAVMVKTVNVNSQPQSGLSSWRIPTVVTALVSLNAGDFVELRAQRTGTGGVIQISNMLLEGKRVRKYVP